MSSVRAYGRRIASTEAGAAVGLSRVTARRYLEHFADVGLLEVRLKYGATGRPDEAPRVIPEHFHATRLDDHCRQSAQVGIDRREERIAQRSA